jgi:hypothetical protein
VGTGRRAIGCGRAVTSEVTRERDAHRTNARKRRHDAISRRFGQKKRGAASDARARDA